MSRWTIRAEGGSRTADKDQVRRALAILVESGQTFELRGLPSGRSRICKGNDLDAASDAAWELSDGTGVYWTLNPCRHDLDKAASNIDILSRRWLPIDCDAIRPPDVSATEAEKYAAVDLACEIAEHLSSLGWPDGVWIDSGNGGHILYPIDLPTDKLSQQLIKGVLVALGDRFDNQHAKVDRSVHNSARIWKLPGTWVRKGDDSPDRPHRMARLIRAQPDLSEIVTVEMMNAVAFPPRAYRDGSQDQPNEGRAGNGQSSHSPSDPIAPWIARTSTRDLKSYVRSAIDRECSRIEMATPHTSEGRNNTLNRAAFVLATMASWPEMSISDAKIALYEAAMRAGLGESETKKTIESGWKAGSAAGRDRPADDRTKRSKGAAANGHPNGTAKPGAGQPPSAQQRLVVFGSEITPKKVIWLWPDRIAIGFISIFAGRTGIGKSFVLCDFAARLSTGRELPDNPEIRLPVGRVLMISEDPYDYVLAPRLHEMGGDLSRIGFLTWEAMASYTLGDIEMLERAYQEAGEPILIVIDPPANFLGPSDEHKNAEVRQVLMGLVAWLTTKQVACVFITHVNKQVGKGVEAVDRIMGSVAWASTSRIACGFTTDPDQPDRCLMAGIKNNLGSKAKTLAYQIEKTDSLAIVSWQGEVDMTADDAMNQVKKKTRGVCAVEWLEERFRERREWPSDELMRHAREFGLSRNAMFSPEVNALPIRKRRRFDAGGEPAWWWLAEANWPAEKHAGTIETLGILGTLGTQEQCPDEPMNPKSPKNPNFPIVGELDQLPVDLGARPREWKDDWDYIEGRNRKPEGK